MLKWFIFVYPFALIHIHHYLKSSFLVHSIYLGLGGVWVCVCLFVLIHSDSPCLLIGAFRPLTFKVIIDVVGLISTVSITVFFLLPLIFVSIFVWFCHFLNLLVLLHGVVFPTYLVTFDYDFIFLRSLSGISLSPWSKFGIPQEINEIVSASVYNYY